MPFGTQCCFCGGSIAETATDPLHLFAHTVSDPREQGLYAHGECFKRVLHRSVPILLEGLLPDAEEDVGDRDRAV